MADLCRTAVHFDEVRPAGCGFEHEVEADEARKSQVPHHARRRIAHFRRVDHANDGRGTRGIGCLQGLDAEASEHVAAVAHDRPVGGSAGDIFLHGDCRAVAVEVIKVGKVELLERLLQRREWPRGRPELYEAAFRIGCVRHDAYTLPAAAAISLEHQRKLRFRDPSAQLKDVVDDICRRNQQSLSLRQGDEAALLTRKHEGGWRTERCFDQRRHLARVATFAADRPPIQHPHEIDRTLVGGNEKIRRLTLDGATYFAQPVGTRAPDGPNHNSIQPMQGMAVRRERHDLPTAFGQ
jgi:hypothetical protein